MEGETFRKEYLPVAKKFRNWHFVKRSTRRSYNEGAFGLCHLPLDFGDCPQQR